MKRFVREDRGYALVLTLLFMPIFIGLSLLIIDLGRGNNAHSDLYAAADAVALAAAGELDGGPDAITRAKAAMTEIGNSVSFLSLEDGEFEVTLNYVDEEGNPFNVIFLTEIPDNDWEPIDQAWVDTYGTTVGTDANFVYVAAQSRDLDTIFPIPISFTDQDIPVQARAVAGRREAACGITPLFICNPFEEEDGFSNLQTAFSQGKMHGRLVKLHPKGSDTAGPGNFGFLQVGGTSSASAIREYFAGGNVPECYDSSTVDTKPGAATSIKAGLNTRFDIWDAPFKNGPKTYTSAVNVRKGYKRTLKDGEPSTKVCDVELADDPGDEANYKAFGDNLIMENPGNSMPGAFLGSGNWGLTGDTGYFKMNHGSQPTTAQLEAMNSFPDAESPGASLPSRYDVYRYEIANNMMGNASPGGENGLPSCSQDTGNALTPIDPPDRRVIQAAIINCKANEDNLNGQKSLPVEAFASIFLTNPMEGQGGKKTNGTDDPDVPDEGTISVEVIDITGTGGLGTLDNYVRVEGILLR